MSKRKQSLQERLKEMTERPISSVLCHDPIEIVDYTVDQSIIDFVRRCLDSLDNKDLDGICVFPIRFEDECGNSYGGINIDKRTQQKQVFLAYRTSL